MNIDIFETVNNLFFAHHIFKYRTHLEILLKHSSEWEAPKPLPPPPPIRGSPTNYPYFEQNYNYDTVLW